MLNRPSKAVVIRVVGIVGALVALSVFLMLSSVLPDSALAHPHDPADPHPGVGTDVKHIHYDENGMKARCAPSCPPTPRPGMQLIGT